MLKKACCVSFRQSTDINLTCLGGADFPVDESTYIGAVKSLSNDMSESDDVSNNQTLIASCAERTGGVDVVASVRNFKTVSSVEPCSTGDMTSWMIAGTIGYWL